VQVELRQRAIVLRRASASFADSDGSADRWFGSYS
jgi:hypothetical protein